MSPILWAAIAAFTMAAVLGLILWRSTRWGAAFGARAESERLARMRDSPEWTKNKFENSEPTSVMPGGQMLKTLARFWFERGERRPTGSLPHFSKKRALHSLSQLPETGLRLTWLGHSTVLLEMEGRRILFDPMFAERASPSHLAGTTRFSPAALSLAELPPIDAIILSHDHYDHLDMDAIRVLARLNKPFYAPLGVGAHLERWGVAANRIIECDWWEEASVRGLRLVSTPARHFSGRGLQRNRMLWCSWCVIGDNSRVFFGGDSGPSTAFAEIGERFGPFDVALLEIGAWDAAWGEIHMGPRGALTAFEQIHARCLVPIHWATFNLGLHAWYEPAETLLALGETVEPAILTPMLGEPIEPLCLLGQGGGTGRWWRDHTKPVPR